MIRRSKHLWFRDIRYKLWLPHILDRKLNLSFQKNFFIQPAERFSFIFQKRHLNRDHFFFWSQNKLQCPMSFNFSVPNKRVKHSRFYLNKALDRLVHGGYQKYNGLLFITTIRTNRSKHALRIWNFIPKRKMIIFKSIFNLSIFSTYVFKI